MKHTFICFLSMEESQINILELRSSGIAFLIAAFVNLCQSHGEIYGTQHNLILNAKRIY